MLDIFSVSCRYGACRRSRGFRERRKGTKCPFSEGDGRRSASERKGKAMAFRFLRGSSEAAKRANGPRYSFAKMPIARMEPSRWPPRSISVSRHICLSLLSVSRSPFYTIRGRYFFYAVLFCYFSKCTFYEKCLSSAWSTALRLHGIPFASSRA